MDHVRTDKAPAPVGCYEQAVVHGGIVYVSMQLPLAENLDEPAGRSVEEQAETVLGNIAAILDAAGSSLAGTVRLTVYITDIGYARRVNSVCERHFTAHKPARGMVTVAALPLGFSVAMEATAALIPATP